MVVAMSAVAVVGFVLLVVGVLAALLTAAGGDPFAQAARSMAPGTAGSPVQVFVVACAVLVLVLVLVPAVAVAQREGGPAGTDVTEERAAQARLRDSVAFHDAVLAASPDMIYILDARTWVGVWTSRTLATVLGYDAAEIEALCAQGGVPTLVHPADAVGLAAANAAAVELGDGEVVTTRFRVRNRAGGYQWLSRRVTPFARDGAGRVSQVLGIARDITESVESEQRLAAAALHDPLTGLPNRRLLTDRLDVALRSGRDGAGTVVLFCDLDGFKHVNDSGGHAAGDTVLVATAARMRAAVRPGDTVARVGGDEFVVVLQPFGDAHEVRAQAVGVARRILGAVAEPVEVDGISHVVTASVGVALARAGEDPEHALRDADAAMYRAKAGGKDRLAVYDDRLRAEVLARRRVRSMLRSAGPGAPAAVPATVGVTSRR